jgi:ankyrin repeat protein
VKVNGRADACFDDHGSVEGVTALIAAARHGRLSTVQILLDAGADPNGADCIGRTALDWADMNKSERVVRQVRRILEEAGAKEV